MENVLLSILTESAIGFEVFVQTEVLEATSGYYRGYLIY